MNRPALFVASILLLGCGTPIQLLIHNELPTDAEITVAWSKLYGGKRQADETTVRVPRGRAEETFVWYGSHDERGVDFKWRDAGGDHRLHVLSKDFPENAYHAYVSPQKVRFAGRDWMDEIHLNMTSYMAPVFWCCILTVVLPLVILLVRLGKAVRSKRRGDVSG